MNGQTNSLYFNGDFTRVGAKDTKSYVTFKFYGTKFRILGCQDAQGHSTINEVIADEIKIGSFSQSGNIVLDSCLNFEKTALGLGIHTVTIKVLDSSTYGFVFDAIDIDDNGYLIDYYAPTNLIATPSNAKVDLSWDRVEGARLYCQTILNARRPIRNNNNNLSDYLYGQKCYQWYYILLCCKCSS